MSVNPEIGTVKYSIQVNLLSLKKISTKQEIDLYNRAKIQTFMTEWSTTGQLLMINMHPL